MSVRLPNLDKSSGRATGAKTHSPKGKFTLGNLPQSKLAQFEDMPWLQRSLASARKQTRREDSRRRERDWNSRFAVARKKKIEDPTENLIITSGSAAATGKVNVLGKMPSEPVNWLPAAVLRRLEREEKAKARVQETCETARKYIRKIDSLLKDSRHSELMHVKKVIVAYSSAKKCVVLASRASSRPVDVLSARHTKTRLREIERSAENALEASKTAYKIACENRDRLLKEREGRNQTEADLRRELRERFYIPSQDTLESLQQLVFTSGNGLQNIKSVIAALRKAEHSMKGCEYALSKPLDSNTTKRFSEAERWIREKVSEANRDVQEAWRVAKDERKRKNWSLVTSASREQAKRDEIQKKYVVETDALMESVRAVLNRCPEIMVIPLVKKCVSATESALEKVKNTLRTKVKSSVASSSMFKDRLAAITSQAQVASTWASDLNTLVSKLDISEMVELVKMSRFEDLEKMSLARDTKPVVESAKRSVKEARSALESLRDAKSLSDARELVDDVADTVSDARLNVRYATATINELVREAKEQAEILEKKRREIQDAIDEAVEARNAKLDRVWNRLTKRSLDLGEASELRERLRDVVSKAELASDVEILDKEIADLETKSRDIARKHDAAEKARKEKKEMKALRRKETLRNIVNEAETKVEALRLEAERTFRDVVGEGRQRRPSGFPSASKLASAELDVRDAVKLFKEICADEKAQREDSIESISTRISDASNLVKTKTHELQKIASASKEEKISSVESRRKNVQTDLENMRENAKTRIENLTKNVPLSSTKLLSATFEIAKRRLKSSGKPISNTTLESATRSMEVMTKRRAELEDSMVYASLVESIGKSINDLENAKSQLSTFDEEKAEVATSAAMLLLNRKAPESTTELKALYDVFRDASEIAAKECLASYESISNNTKDDIRAKIENVEKERLAKQLESLRNSIEAEQAKVESLKNKGETKQKELEKISKELKEKREEVETAEKEIEKKKLEAQRAAEEEEKRLAEERKRKKREEKERQERERKEREEKERKERERKTREEKERKERERRERQKKAREEQEEKKRKEREEKKKKKEQEEREKKEQEKKRKEEEKERQKQLKKKREEEERRQREEEERRQREEEELALRRNREREEEERQKQKEERQRQKQKEERQRQKEDESQNKEQHEFAVGDKCAARFGGGEDFYSCTITKVIGNGTYDVQYDDGDCEYAVPTSLISAMMNLNEEDEAQEALRHEEQQRKVDTKFYVGQDVACLYQGGEDAYAAVVAAINTNGTYEIHYNDGDVEHEVPEENLRTIKQEEEEEEVSKFKVGDEIGARYNGGEDWYPGVIVKVNGDGTYDINYSDGEKESGALEENIMHLKEMDTGSVAKTESEEEEDEKERGYEFHVGDEVACQLNGDWYSGFIGAINDNGTADITFEDGDAEPGVPMKNIKLLSEVSVSEASSSDDDDDDDDDDESEEESEEGGEKDTPADYVAPGTKVAVRYHGGDEVYAGTIAEIDKDGTFTVKYDDGEIETNVPPGHISVIEDSPQFEVGMQIVCRYKGTDDFYEGVIVNIKKGNLYDVKYSDHEIEENIPEHDIQHS